MPDRDAVDRAFAEAYQTLGRLADCKVERRDIHPDDDVLIRRSREIQERAEPAPKPTPAPRQTDAQLQAYVDGKIARALAEHDARWERVIGMVVAEERKRCDAKIDKAKSETRSGVIDLPGPFVRKRDAA